MAVVIADIDKIASIADFLDWEVAVRSIRDGAERWAAMRAIVQELGHEIEFFGVGPWYVASAQSSADHRHLSWHNDKPELWDDASELDIESRQGKWVVAASAEAAAKAVICLLLDSNVDVAMDPDRLIDLFPLAFRPCPFMIEYAVSEYICQERWFGDVPQYGSAVEQFGVRELLGEPCI